MSSPSNPTSHKSTALAANAMIDEGGAIAQPSKEESEAALDKVVEKRRRKSRTASSGSNEASGDCSI